MTVPKKKRLGRAYHHGDLRRALLDRARELVETGGVDALRMSALSADLGVSVAAPFRHFPSREGLLVALAEEGMAKMLRAMDEAAGHERSPLEAHRARGVAYVRFAVQHPAYFRLLSRPEVVRASKPLQAASQDVRDRMDPVLGRWHGGKVSHEIAQRSAGLLAAQALTYGLARMIVDGLLGDVSQCDAERLAVELTGVLGEGIAARPRDAE